MAKKILEKGKKPTKTISYYKTRCPVCNTLFEFTTSDCDALFKGIDAPVGIVSCPVCERQLDVCRDDWDRDETVDVLKKYSESIDAFSRAEGQFDKNYFKFHNKHNMDEWVKANQDRGIPDGSLFIIDALDEPDYFYLNEKFHPLSLENVDLYKYTVLEKLKKQNKEKRS